jgi:hypothetical protein
MALYFGAKTRRRAVFGSTMKMVPFESAMALRAPSGMRLVSATEGTSAALTSTVGSSPVDPRYDTFILMANAAKIACSIDADLLARIESVRARTGESRSALISRALIALTSESARTRAVSRYIEAYREHPETVQEVRSARRSAHRALSRVDWDDE